MENPTFEMHGEGIPGGKSAGNEGIPPKKNGNLLKIFLLSLLACSLTTTITILALSLIFVERTEILRNSDVPAPPENPGKGVEPKFQFLYHLPKSKVYTFPGGEIQWARFRRDPLDYGSPAEREFGSSLNSRRSQLTFGTLRIRGGGLRAPHWHFNANEHGFLLQGSAWIGVIGPDNSTATTFTVSAGQVVFFPKNTVHWIKNSGARDCLFLLFFSTHQELLTLDVDDAFFDTPEDVLARALQPEGGVKFIRTFRRPGEDQAVNLPENLDELVQNSSYSQSPDPLVWRYFYDLQGSQEFPFPGGTFRWARYRRDGAGLTDNQKIFSESLHQHADTLTLAILRIFGNGLGQPHFHFNAHEMGYVLSGCGEAGVILAGSASVFPIGIGDLLFFPTGTQHFLRSTCQEELVLLLAYSTGDQLETLRMSQYFHGTADHILAQLFFKKQEEFQKFPKPAP
ncbi:uncharacterized protein LOC127464143 isoform X1 [Manacus candei]|uniref:uncharacterized protein LOC127464143 isoform X1 n=1 Tax=Manacus candei TaxID=415023 RepID=UPI002225F885|nr:uncharacterized protein LOC127464143 isoform X1 [Manacus candei]XP_051630275.1 uncharacterized protein LOC127464143 isoform X1 [Manacus candei]